MYDRPMEQAVNRADVKANNAVKQVASPVTSDPWEIHDTALMLMGCDSGAQRSFFRASEFDSCGSKQFGPPLTESGCCDLVSRLFDIMPADEVKGTW